MIVSTRSSSPLVSALRFLLLVSSVEQCCTVQVTCFLSLSTFTVSGFRSEFPVEDPCTKLTTKRLVDNASVFEIPLSSFDFQELWVLLSLLIYLLYFATGGSLSLFDLVSLILLHQSYQLDLINCILPNSSCQMYLVKSILGFLNMDRDPSLYTASGGSFIQTWFSVPN